MGSVVLHLKNNQDRPTSRPQRIQWTSVLNTNNYTRAVSGTASFVPSSFCRSLISSIFSYVYLQLPVPHYPPSILNADHYHYSSVTSHAQRQLEVPCHPLLIIIFYIVFCVSFELHWQSHCYRWAFLRITRLCNCSSLVATLKFFTEVYALFGCALRLTRSYSSFPDILWPKKVAFID